MVSIVHAARDLGRVRDISKVLVRHGFGEIVSRLGMGRSKKGTDGPAQRKPCRRVAGRGGFATSSRTSGLLRQAGRSPRPAPTSCGRGHHGAPKCSKRAAAPAAAIRERIEQSLGAPLGSIFESFDDTPLARRQRRTGEKCNAAQRDGLYEVVVKVQTPKHPPRRSLASLDLRHTFATLLEQSHPDSRSYSPVGMVNESTGRCRTSSTSRSSGRTPRGSSQFPDFPGPVSPSCTAAEQARITLEYLDGLKIDDAVQQGFRGRDLARMAMHIIVKQILRGRLSSRRFQPGNVLVMGSPSDPSLPSSDRKVGRLGPRMRDLTIDLMVALLAKTTTAWRTRCTSTRRPTKKVEMRAYRAEVACSRRSTAQNLRETSYRP